VTHLEDYLAGRPLSKELQRIHRLVEKGREDLAMEAICDLQLAVLQDEMRSDLVMVDPE
jgi:hypothetical protein